MSAQDAAPFAPLAGVRVLDLTNVLAGPFCTYQLALLGAEVIKIERPGSGDLARQLGARPDLNQRGMGASFLAQNAGKKSVTLNLKHPEGRRIFEQLAAAADVVVENFRPGVMERMGLGYERLRSLNPSLIYCAISGFGQTGELAQKPAYDQIIQGYSGVMAVTGTPETAPLRVGFPVCDTAGGLTACMAVLAGLLQRQRTGSGTFIDVSMLDSIIPMMGWIVSNYLIAGAEPQPMGNDNFTAAPSGTFRTAQGLLNIAANEQQQFEALCQVLGHPEWVSDPRFQGRESRKRHRQELNRLIEAALQSASAAEWETRLTERGVPAGPVLSVPEILAHPHVRQRGLLVRMEQVAGVGEPVSVVAMGATFDGRRPAPAAAPPVLGAHTDDILRQLGYTDPDIERLRREGVV